MADTTKFGYINAWARGGQEGLEGLVEEYSIPDGIALGGNVSIKEEQAKLLIAYLQNPDNLTEYGYKLDFAIFYNEESKVKFGGAITTPYVKDGGGAKTKGTASSRAKRAI